MRTRTGRRITHIEIRNRPPRVDGPGDHLEELISGNSVAHAGIKKCREWGHDRARGECYDVRPHGKRRLAFEHADKTYAYEKGIIDILDTTRVVSRALTSKECQEQQKNVPPPGSLLVLLYGNPVGIRLCLVAGVLE